jgi:hypothetical protein
MELGFSTGALALNDFRRGVDLQSRDDISAIELSALRESELDSLVDALSHLNLTRFKAKSFHAPSKLVQISNEQLIEKLKVVADSGFHIVVHPDIIEARAIGHWRELGPRLLLENMDQRKRVCRTAKEMAHWFELLPEAGLCFDLGHARQVDPTMSIAVDFLTRYSGRIREVHISEVNWQCRHVSISSAAAMAFAKVSRLISKVVPVIIESLIRPALMDKEIETVRRCMRGEAPFVSYREITRHDRCKVK